MTTHATEICGLCKEAGCADKAEVVIATEEESQSSILIIKAKLHDD